VHASRPPGRLVAVGAGRPKAGAGRRATGAWRATPSPLGATEVAAVWPPPRAPAPAGGRRGERSRAGGDASRHRSGPPGTRRGAKGAVVRVRPGRVGVAGRGRCLLQGGVGHGQVDGAAEPLAPEALGTPVRGICLPEHVFAKLRRHPDGCKTGCRGARMVPVVVHLRLVVPPGLARAGPRPALARGARRGVRRPDRHDRRRRGRPAGHLPRLRRPRGDEGSAETLLLNLVMILTGGLATLTVQRLAYDRRQRVHRG
jgi:hypothetical protein